MLASGVRHASTMAAVLASSHGASVGRAKGSVVLLHIPGDVAQLPDQPSGQMVAGARLMLLPGLSVLADVRWATRVDGSDHSHDGAAAVPVPLPARRARVAPSSGHPFGWFVGWLKLNMIESRLRANLAASRCGESDGGVDGGRMGGGSDGGGGLGGAGDGGGGLGGGGDGGGGLGCGGDGGGWLGTGGDGDGGGGLGGGSEGGSGGEGGWIGGDGGRSVRGSHGQKRWYVDKAALQKAAVVVAPLS